MLAIISEQLLTEQELCQYVLPNPQVHENLTKSTTNSAFRKVPNEPVKLWETFLDDAFTASSKIDHQTRCFSAPTIENQWVRDEHSTTQLFLRTMDAANNQRLRNLPRMLGCTFLVYSDKRQPRHYSL
jgi:hypothetical protein